MNTTYLIDLENVNSGGFEGADNLDESDELIVFFSEKADTLKIPTITALLKTAAQIKFYKCKNGIMNAMDFDIVSVLGIICTQDREFVIVSRDKGFDVVVERYRSFGKKNVSRWVTIAAAKKRAESAPTEEPVQETFDVSDKLATEPANDMEEVLYSAPAVPEIEPDRFEAEISKAMEQTAPPADTDSPAASEATPEPETKQEPAPAPVKKTTKPKKQQPKPEQAQPRKKKPAAAEMSRIQKGKVNQFLNNLMGAKHEQPMTKDELKLIRETAEATKTKNAFYNALRKQLGNDKGIALYNRIKDHYDEIAKFIADVKTK